MLSATFTHLFSNFTQCATSWLLSKKFCVTACSGTTIHCLFCFRCTLVFDAAADAELLESSEDSDSESVSGSFAESVHLSPRVRFRGGADGSSSREVGTGLLLVGVEDSGCRLGWGVALTLLGVERQRVASRAFLAIARAAGGMEIVGRPFSERTRGRISANVLRSFPASCDAVLTQI